MTETRPGWRRQRSIAAIVGALGLAAAGAFLFFGGPARPGGTGDPAGGTPPALPVADASPALRARRTGRFVPGW